MHLPSLLNKQHHDPRCYSVLITEFPLTILVVIVDKTTVILYMTLHVLLLFSCFTNLFPFLSFYHCRCLFRCSCQELQCDANNHHHHHCCCSVMCNMPRFHSFFFRGGKCAIKLQRRLVVSLLLLLSFDPHSN